MSDEDARLSEVLDKLTTDAVHLRMAAQLPRPDASTGELLDALLDVRRRLDRVEELLATALQLRGVAARKHSAVDIQVSDAWDEVAVRQRKHTVRDEYASAKERAAATNLEILDLRHLERRARSQLRYCDEAVDAIRLRHSGLQGLRQDILSVVRIRQFETSMER